MFQRRGTSSSVSSWCDDTASFTGGSSPPSSTGGLGKDEYQVGDKIPLQHSRLAGAAPIAVAKPSLFANTHRLWEELHETAKWGAIPDSMGMERLTLNDADKNVRDYFVQAATELGCSVRIDEMGNIFAILPGENNDLAPIGIGSHLDTQPAGGRFDGILGVLGGLEILRTIREAGVVTYAPIAAINWTNEEGARFSPGCSGSAVWAGHIPLQQAHELEDAEQCTMAGELHRIGYLGNVPADHRENALSSHFELHIEQRPRLQNERKKIGVVTRIQGNRWYRVRIQGERAHGSTPMCDRADAVALASKVVTFLETEAIQRVAVATVGKIELDRPSSNTVPGDIEFTVDIRHPEESVLEGFETALVDYLDELAAANAKASHSIQRIWRSPAVPLQEEAVSCTRRAAADVVGPHNTIDLISYAGHDSALTAMQVPTSMIFVPSKNGISHAPEEYTSEAECGGGVQVLLEAVLECDWRLRGGQM